MMNLFSILVLLAIVAISARWMRRVMVVFAATPLLRICGAILFVASVFVALTAVGGGITLAIGFDKFPPEWLTGTPFRSYVIPGFILAVVVGGSAAAAAAAVLRKASTGALVSLLAGAILLGWLLGERLILPPVAFVPQFWWLEAAYIAIGLMMVVPAVAVRLSERTRLQ
jgi:hypothetical protein